MPPLPSPLCVLADDLSGAVESAALLGPGTPVHLDLDLRPRPRSGHRVLDVDARGLDAGRAADRLEQAWDAVGPDRVFVKVDSLLRGPVAAAVDVARRHGTVVLCPALPTEGRTVVDGVLLCSGVPLAHTDAWRLEPADPPASIAALLPDRPVRSFGTADLRDGTFAGAARRAGPEVLVCDAETPADLRTVGRVLDAEPHLVGVGSAQLLAGWTGTGASPGSDPTRPPPPGRTTAVLVVVGSASREAREQTRRLLARPSTAEVEVPLTGGRLDADPLVPALRSARARVGTTVLTLPPPEPGTGCAVDPDVLARDLGAAVADALGSDPSDLVLIGGSTARAVLDALGVGVLRVRAAIHPGAVATEDPSGRVVVTRPGSHGPPTSLLDILDRLEGHLP